LLPAFINRQDKTTDREGGECLQPVAMNLLLLLPEIAVVVLGLALLLLDLWTPAPQKRSLGYVAMAMLALILAGTFLYHTDTVQYAFNGMFIIDSLAIFFKRFFIVAAFLVILMSMEYADQFEGGMVEYYVLVLFALSGMMGAASAHHFAVLFVSLELITVSFYVLTSFQRERVTALEAGIKYLILGAVASAFLVFGMAFVFGATGSLDFSRLATVASGSPLALIYPLGIALVLVGLGFKIAAFPFQVWAPDVYQGGPAPTVAFLAAGSKAAGFTMLLRVLASLDQAALLHWRAWLLAVSGITILYGSLCAIPQRNLKRLMGYSSIANAGYLLLGVVAFSASGVAALLYFLVAYLFALMAVFTVICLVMRTEDSEQIQALSGLHQRSPLLAAALALGFVSLAGIPPLAGFFGKFLLIKSVIERGATSHSYYGLAGIALVGVVISLYYYFGVIKAVYWPGKPVSQEPLDLSRPVRWSLLGCLAVLLFLGIFPNPLFNWASQVATSLPWK
jgi:NADH-quinone oxidoreductase subunit N